VLARAPREGDRRLDDLRRRLQREAHARARLRRGDVDDGVARRLVRRDAVLGARAPAADVQYGAQPVQRPVGEAVRESPACHGPKRQAERVARDLPRRRGRAGAGRCAADEGEHDRRSAHGQEQRIP